MATLTKQECGGCGVNLEFDSSQVGRDGYTILCPKCGQAVTLCHPPPVVLAASVKPRPRRTVKPFEIRDIFKWIIFIWSGLCALGAIMGFLNIASSRENVEAFDRHPTASTLGFLFGLFIWGALWALVALPAAILWLVSGKSKSA